VLQQSETVTDGAQREAVTEGAQRKREGVTVSRQRLGKHVTIPDPLLGSVRPTIKYLVRNPDRLRNQDLLTD
jgi:hypothetical protein